MDGVKRKQENAYSSDREYRVLRWALRSITLATITEVRIKAIILYSGWRTLSFGTISMTLFCRNISRLSEKEGNHIQQVFQREQRCLAMKLVVRLERILDESLAKFVKVHVNA